MRCLHRWLLSICIGSSFYACCLAPAWTDEPLALRFENLPLLPAQQPALVVVAWNRGNQTYRGTLRVETPESWRLDTKEQALELAAGESQRVRFQVREADHRADNSYPCRVTASNGREVTHHQWVMVATAPYFKPTIDGNDDDWDKSVPVAWPLDDKRIEHAVYWNRRQLSMLVKVREAHLVPFDPGSGDRSFDAVQLAIAPRGAETGRSPEDEVHRFEFLIAAGASNEGRCFLLAQPGMKLEETQQHRPWPSLEFESAEVAVRRSGDWTVYECALPFSLMRDQIRPSEGREFQMSLLVHDADQSQLYDWGSSAGLWQAQRNRFAWSKWKGSSFGADAPFDSKTVWGLCSSKY